MQLTLCNFSKRMNSTKQPTAADLAAGKTFNDLTLKELTNIDNPVLKLAGAIDNDYAYNYAYVHDWGRYYHIKTADLRHQDIYTARLELDDLATFKSQILNTSAYIVYASTGFNRWIKDDRTPIVARPPEVLLSHSSPTIGDYAVFDDDQVSPTIVLCTVSQESGLTYWKMNKSSIDHLLDSLTRAGSTVWGALQQQFGDALGSIISAYRIPINPMVMPSGTIREMYLGSYHVQDGEQSYIEATQLPNESKFILFNGRCGIPTGYLDYRVFEPYTKLKIRLPFVGLCDISHQDFAGSVYYQGLVNLINGKIVWTLFNDEEHSKAIATFSGQCGEQIPMAVSQIQSAESLINAVSGTVNTAAATILNPTAGFVSGVASIANSFYHLTKETSNVIGSYSGGITEIINKRVEIIAEKMQTAIEPDNLTAFEGRPVCKVDTLSSYSGYIKTQGFSIDIAANSDVINSINKKLDAGIYIE